MKKNNFYLAIFVGMFVFTCMTGCAGNSKETVKDTGTHESNVALKSEKDGDSDEFPEITLKLGTQEPDAEDNQYQKFATLFKELVEERTDGKVVIDIYPNSLLANETAMMEGFTLGEASYTELGVFTGNGYGNFYPEYKVCDLPFLFDDRYVAQDYFDSDFVKELMEEGSKHTNCVVLGWGEGGFRYILNNIRPITRPEDIADIKLRVPETQIFMDTFKALGGNPTPMAYSETFTGLQQKTIDGVEVPIANAYTVRYQEVCKYMSATGHFYNALFIGMNKTIFDKLGPNLQEVLRECAVEAGNEQRKFTIDNEQRMLEEMEAAGLQFNDDVDKEAFRSLVVPVYNDYKENISTELYEKAMNTIETIKASS